MNCSNSGNSKWLKQYENEPFFKRKLYPFQEEGFCANRAVGVCYSRANRPANIGANRNANHLLTQMLTRLAASSTNHFAIATLIAL
jgi:hypothetical protein